MKTKYKKKNGVNLLILGNNNIDPFSGGIERSVFNLIAYLSRHTDYKLILCFKKIENINHPNVSIIKTVISNGKQINDIILKYKVDVVLFPFGPWYANLLTEFNSSLKCKIITCLHSEPGYELRAPIEKFNWDLKHMNGSKYVLAKTYHFFAFHTIHRIKAYITRKVYNKGYRNSKFFVLLSSEQFKLFEKFAYLKNGQKLRAIGNPLSFDYIFNDTDYSQKENRVLVVSRMLEYNKRILMAIKAWNKVDYGDWIFDIVGDGPDLKYYKRFVRENNINNIVFHGRKDPIEFYKKAKIFLMTSTSEGWPMTLMESIQMGVVPIVMDSFVALHDIIRNDYNGIIVKNKDIDGMSFQLQNLIRDEKKLSELAHNGVKSSKRYTVEIIGEKWISLFEEAMRES